MSSDVLAEASKSARFTSKPLLGEKSLSWDTLVGVHGDKG